MRNKQASIHNILVAHQQNQMIRRAILASGNSPEFARMRKVYSMILSNSKTAFSGAGTMDGRAAVQQIQEMLRNNSRFRQAYLAV